MENKEIVETGELNLDESQELTLDNETMDQLNSLAAPDGEDSSDKLTASEIAVLIGAIAGGFMLLKWLIEKGCKGCVWAVKRLKAFAAKQKAKKAAKQDQDVKKNDAPAAQANEPAPEVTEETKTEEKKENEE